MREMFTVLILDDSWGNDFWLDEKSSANCIMLKHGYNFFVFGFIKKTDNWLLQRKVVLTNFGIELTF